MYDICFSLNDIFWCVVSTFFPTFLNREDPEHGDLLMCAHMHPHIHLNIQIISNIYFTSASLDLTKKQLNYIIGIVILLDQDTENEIINLCLSASHQRAFPRDWHLVGLYAFNMPRV